MGTFRFQGVDELEDSDQSIKFCNLVNRLSDVMNSRTPKNALRPNSAQIEVLTRLIIHFVIFINIGILIKNLFV